MGWAIQKSRTSDLNGWTNTDECRTPAITEEAIVFTCLNISSPTAALPPHLSELILISPLAYHAHDTHHTHDSHITCALLSVSLCTPVQFCFHLTRNAMETLTAALAHPKQSWKSAAEFGGCCMFIHFLPTTPHTILANSYFATVFDSNFDTIFLDHAAQEEKDRLCHHLWS